MSVLSTVTDLQNQTAFNQVRNNKEADRKAGGEMGKHDFLLLLSAQLRFQDPLNPQNDSDFAAGLAQFSALEQMQNMNNTLETMNSFQAYSLVGKFVIAEAVVDGKTQEVAGIVDSIFTNGGQTFAQIGEIVVPISSIKEVFNTDNVLTSEMLLTASNNLIGRVVTAKLDDKEIEGVVTRVYVEKGSLYAQIDDGSGEPKFVPVNSIIDIREKGTEKHTPKPATPPNAVNFKPDGKGGFIEYDEDLETQLGRWDWNEAKWKWVYTAFESEKGNEETNVGEETNIGEETDIEEESNGSGDSEGIEGQMAA